MVITRQLFTSQQTQEQALGDMKFASPTSDYSTTGLREAKFKSVGDVRTKEKSTEDYVERRKREAKEGEIGLSERRQRFVH